MTLAINKIQYVERTLPTYKHSCGMTLYPAGVYRMGFSLWCDSCGKVIKEESLPANFLAEIKRRRGW